MNERTVLHLEQRVTSWLAADAPPRARRELLASTLERVASVPQDRPLAIALPMPWRALDRRRLTWAPTGRSRMVIRLAVAIALIAVLAIGAALIGSPRNQVRPVPTTAPTGLATPVPERGILPTANGPLAAGRYTFEPIFDVPVTIHLSVPDGWQQAGWAIQKAGMDLHLSFWTVEDTYTDPCHWTTTALGAALGRSVSDLAAALRAQVGRTVTAPEAIAVGGHSGLRLDLVVPDSIGTEACDQGEYRDWVGPGNGDASRWVPVQVGYAGYVDTAWIIDVDGFRLVIDVTRSTVVTAVDLAEAEAIVESITIDDVSAGVRFGSCTLDVSTTVNPVDLPSPLPSGGVKPSVSMSAVGSGWGVDGPGRPTVSLVQPDGQVQLPGVGLSGGVLDTGYDLDAVGTWRLRVVAWGVGCLVEVPIEVPPVDTG
jgi:hypothetical protein